MKNFALIAGISAGVLVLWFIFTGPAKRSASAPTATRPSASAAKATEGNKTSLTDTPKQTVDVNANFVKQAVQAVK